MQTLHGSRLPDIPVLIPMDTDRLVFQAQELLDFNEPFNPLNPAAVMTSLPHTKGQTIMVKVGDIKVFPGFNPRIQNQALFDHIRNIADSIKSEGFYAHKPLAVTARMEGKKQVLYVTEGGCRFAAANLAISEDAPLTELPVVISGRATTDEDLLTALIRSNQQLGFSTLELAICVKRYTRFGLTPSAIAQKLSYTPEYVNQLLTIAGAPTLIRQMIAEGEVPAAVAIQAMRTNGAVQAVEVLQTAVAQAKAEGKSGITRKHLPDQIYRRAITKAAPNMVTAIERVKAHAAFQTLPDDLQDMIDKLLEGIVKAKPETTEPQAQIEYQPSTTEETAC